MTNQPITNACETLSSARAKAEMTIRNTSRINYVCGAILYFAVVIALRADTITVTNTNDSGSGSLRQALVNATDGDTIDATGVSGVITLTSGELLVNKSVTISGSGANNLAVDGNARNRVFHIDPGITVVVSALTITNGNACCILPDNLGGGVYNDHAALTLSNCTISDNSALDAGAGLYNDGSLGSASAEIIGSIFVKNHATLEGGAIYNNGNGGAAILNVQASIINSNSADAEGLGGGIYNSQATATVDSCTISDNAANKGAGIYNYGPEGGPAVLQVSNSTLSGNSAQYGGGGAIYNDGSIFGSANVHITNSTLSGNSTTYYDGGGIYNNGYAGNAILQIENSTLGNNSAPEYGGTIFNIGGGGGETVVDLANTVLKAGTLGANIFNAEGTVTSHGYNLSNDDGGGYLIGPGDQVNTDPLLGPLRDNGGPTLTHRPLPGSPAIDAGDPSFTPPPLYDQRGPGFDRVVNGGLDIGSFEVQTGKPTPTPTPRPRPTPTPRPRPGPHSRPTPP
jgi:hypothetical protein